MKDELNINEINSKREAKKIVDIVGFGLGNLIWRIYKGDFKKENSELLKYKGTRYFILGGSIGTNGYTKIILPFIAQKQIIKLADSKKIPKILEHHFNSSNIGALGAYYAFDDKVKRRIKKLVKKTYSENKIPLLPLIDIGGTKINMVLAHLSSDGELNYKILKNYTFVTCKYDNPVDFYNQLVQNIKPIFDNFNTGIYEIIPILGIGQPGLMDGPQGIIKDGAKDLGITTTTFLNCNPSLLCHQAFSNIKYNIDVYVCNDGIAQFNGLLLGIKTEDKELWKELCQNDKTKIMYLGLGTGLGSGCGLINKDGSYTIDDFRGAYKIKTINDWENIIYDDEFVQYDLIEKLPHTNYEYGDLLSGKFFRKYMHLWEYINLKKKRPLDFIPYTGLTEIPKNFDQILLSGINDNSSLLNAIIVNKILDSEIIPTKAEIIVECSYDEIKTNLNKILNNYSTEIGETLVKNVGEREYIEVVNKVVEVNKNGNTIHFVGIGKSHSIGDNLSYKFCNLGLRSSCLELTGADAENLTNINEGDIVFMISNSGKAWELLNLIPYIKDKGCYTVAITGQIDSPLARNCDNTICSKVKDITNDIARLPEAPTTTTTSALAVGTAIGIVVAHYFDYSKEKFYLDHPNLIYNDIIFEGKLADPNFDINIKIKDIFKQFAKAIDNINKTTIYKQIINLLKKILASYYNKRTIFLTGSGSSLHVAEKISATMTSIGIDAAVVNPAQLPHGDFAHIIKGDLLIIISSSGETSSLKYVYDLAINKGVDSVLITSNENSYIARKTNPNYVIVGENVNDTKLINIPDQKILQSFLNLAVGDVIAVLLAWLIKTTHQQFATLGHQGGAIERENINYAKYLENNINKDLILKNDNARNHFLNILKNHLSIIDKTGVEEKEMLNIIKNEMTNYHNRLNNKEQSVLIFGMGSMGLAYIGRILSNLNKNLIYVENDKEKIKSFADKSTISLVSDNKNYNVKIKEILSCSEVIKIATHALNIDLVFIAVGVNNILSLIDTIIFIVLRRYAYNIQVPINFVFDENFQLNDVALEDLHYEIYRKIENPNIKNYFNEFVGLVPAVNEAIVPELVNGESVIKVEEKIAPLYIDKSKWKIMKNDKYPIFNKNIILEDNFISIHMRKLWMHNMAHSLIAYLGKSLGYKTINEAISNKNIEDIVRKAMMTIGGVLYRRWDYSKTEHKSKESYINWCINRYKNTFLNDTISRVGRNVDRKLRLNDRLIGPLNYIWKYDRVISREILLGIIAAMNYDIKNYEQLYNHVVQNIEFDSDELIKAEKEFSEFVSDNIK